VAERGGRGKGKVQIREGGGEVPATGGWQTDARIREGTPGTGDPREQYSNYCKNAHGRKRRGTEGQERVLKNGTGR